MSIFFPLRSTVSVLTGLMLLVLLGVGGSALEAEAQPGESGAGPIVLDDFGDYEPGTFPDPWVYVESKDEFLSYEESRSEGETVVVREEDGNKFVRLITEGEALRYSLRNGADFEWNLNDHPRLEWRWRAQELPEGASEKGKNDTGGAVYVTFGSDWLGRPKSIKYTYSSSLDVGTVVSFGVLKVIVVDSVTEPRLGEWKTHQRDVIRDYRQVFGGDPPDEPVSITIWSDSDTVEDGRAEVDIDDIRLLPPRR